MTTPQHLLDQAATLAADGQPSALIVVLLARGSAPRESGAIMLAGLADTWGTIGGGNLEYQALAQARALLESGSSDARVISFPLGPLLGQCCGGNVCLLIQPLGRDQITRLARGNSDDRLVFTLGDSPGVARLTRQQAHNRFPLWEPLGEARLAVDTRGKPARPDAVRALSLPVDDCDNHLMLFGAGHVGQALVQALQALPFKVTWVDSRADMMPESPGRTVTPRVVGDPVAVVASAPAGAHWLVMTHDHGLDYQLVKAILLRRDAHFIGLIGSKTKRANFERDLARETDLTPGEIAAMHCPIGLADIKGKEPAVIAASVAAQLLAWRRD